MNSISEAAVARFVHHVVACEHLKVLNIDREFNSFSQQLESDSYFAF